MTTVAEQRKKAGDAVDRHTDGVSGSTRPVVPNARAFATLLVYTVVVPALSLLSLVIVVAMFVLALVSVVTPLFTVVVAAVLQTTRRLAGAGCRWATRSAVRTPSRVCTSSEVDDLDRRHVLTSSTHWKTVAGLVIAFPITCVLSALALAPWAYGTVLVVIGASGELPTAGSVAGSVAAVVFGVALMALGLFVTPRVVGLEQQFSVTTHQPTSATVQLAEQSVAT